MCRLCPVYGAAIPSQRFSKGTPKVGEGTLCLPAIQALVIRIATTGGRRSLRVSLLCLTEANRMLVTKTLPQDVAQLVFVP